MITKKQNSKLAFSLIELSIVILIIGILIIGISKGSRIIKASKLKTAQSLTNSSPVASTEGLMLWYEATLDKSFNVGENIDTAFGANGTISSWNDINPQTTTANNAGQSGASSIKPRYRVSAINGLPALNFDGTDDYLTYDGTKLVNTNYTIFVVEQRRSANQMYYIGGLTQAANQMLEMGYTGSTLAYWDQFLAYPQFTIPGYSSPTPRVHSFVHRGGVQKDYYINGNLMGSPSGGYAANLTSYNGAVIGTFAIGQVGWYYVGDIGEIIMFTRALKTSERVSIENYLKAKWGIK